MKQADIEHHAQSDWDKHLAISDTVTPVISPSKDERVAAAVAMQTRIRRATVGSGTDAVVLMHHLTSSTVALPAASKSPVIQLGATWTLNCANSPP